MIFVAYSHRDEAWLNELRTMAAPLRKYGGLQPFSDKDIKTGADWRQAIKKFLDNAAIAVLLVSRHFLDSQFIIDEELPEILRAREGRGLQVIWVLVSHCLYEDTPLEGIQAALPTSSALEEMSESKKNAALKTICKTIKDAFEKPVLDPALNGMKVSQKMPNLKLLLRPTTRFAEVFVRQDNQKWYHQGAIPPGHRHLRCYFGNDKTLEGTSFRITAMTMETGVPDQGGKPTDPMPECRTRADEVRVIRT